MFTKQLETVKHKLTNIQQVKSYTFDEMQKNHNQYVKNSRLYGDDDYRTELALARYEKMYDLWSQLDDYETLLNKCLIDLGNVIASWEDVQDFERRHQQ